MSELTELVEPVEPVQLLRPVEPTELTKLTKNGKPIGRPKKWTEAKAIELAQELVDWFNADEGNIFYTEFCALKGLDCAVISRLQSVSETFKQAVKKVEKLSEARLVRKGMKPGQNPGMAIFVLKNKHGYADKRETTSVNTTSITIEDRSKLKAQPDEQLNDSLRWLTEPVRKG